ncbi:MAG: acyl-protein synthetase [Deltaproteobacteria bacterium]|nr:acyl-protein synthetase [Deltaproteobacteria bacterium]
MSRLDQSRALHLRVRSHARAGALGIAPAEDFDELALEIAAYQARHHAGYARLLAARGGLPGSARDLPAVPVDAFRLGRVAVHPEAEDELVFLTSGTTSGARGRHPVREPGTYRELALLGARRALIAGSGGPRVVVALAPDPGARPSSSLGYMMRLLMEELDGRALELGTSFAAGEPGRWLAGADGVDLRGLGRAIDLAGSRGEPLLLLATGFALVTLLDALGPSSLPLPAGSVVMPTGGTKGRTREVGQEELRDLVALAFELLPEQIVGEYGMTELTSQLYEGTLPGAAVTGPRGSFLSPPWLRVDAVDPATLRPLPEGESGLARFLDLGNVDSAVAVVTQDRIRCVDGAVELLGRLPGAPPRGCSLALEELVLGGITP